MGVKILTAHPCTVQPTKGACGKRFFYGLINLGQVDSTRYDTTPIREFITQRHGVEPLVGLCAKAGNLSVALA